MPKAGPGSRVHRLHLAGALVDSFQKICTVYNERGWASRVFQGLREALKFRKGHRLVPSQERAPGFPLDGTLGPGSKSPAAPTEPQ
eukprot:7324710-Pyramimonas_sp.AAC.1